VRIGDQGIPLLGRHMGAHCRAQIGGHSGLAEGHDLPLEPHLQAAECLGFRPAEFDLKPLQSSHLAQPCQHGLHTRLGPGDCAIHTLVGQQDRAAHGPSRRQLEQLLPQRRQLLQRREAVEGRHQHAHWQT